jgi:hypothetical protein
MQRNNREAALAPKQRIDWSDSWSDEDLNEFRAASLRRLDAEESDNLPDRDAQSESRRR